MRLILCTFLCVAALAGCSISAGRLAVLERREKNLVNEIEVLNAERLSLVQDFERLMVNVSVDGTDDQRAQVAAQEPRVLATADAMAAQAEALKDRLAEVRREISDLVD